MSENFREPDTITVDEYVRLFTDSKAMHYVASEFLKAHFSSPDYTSTAEQLAYAVGRKKHEDTNLLYGGQFAKKLAKDFGWTQQDKEMFGFDWLWFLIEFSGIASNGHVILKLRPNAVEALKQMGWKNVN